MGPHRAQLWVVVVAAAAAVVDEAVAAAVDEAAELLVVVVVVVACWLRLRASRASPAMASSRMAPTMLPATN